MTAQIPGKRTKQRFRSIQGLRRFVASVLERLDATPEELAAQGKPPLETDTAKVMLYGAKVLAELISDSALETRMRVLEMRTLPISDKSLAAKQLASGPRGAQQ